MTPRWLIEEGLLKGKELVLPSSSTEWKLGRSPELCDLIVADPEVEPLHLVVRKEKEEFYLEPLAPFYHNGKASVSTVRLEQGDTVRIGCSLMRFATDKRAERTQIEHHWTGQERWSSLLKEKRGEGPLEQRATTDQIAERSDQEGDMLAEVNFDIIETGRWLLKVVNGPNAGAEFFLQTGSSYLIGTDPSHCDIIFHDTSVSRQHARLTVSDEQLLLIEDLDSRNGTAIDGRRLAARESLPTNTIVTVGTTSFIVLDREGEMQTVISPILPSSVKTLQEEKPVEKTDVEKKSSAKEKAEQPISSAETLIGTFVVTAAITGILVVVGLGTLALFRGEPVQVEQVGNASQQLDKAIVSRFPDLKYSFTSATGNLLVVGHVSTQADKQQLLYSLEAMPFIAKFDDKVIVDELITREINPILARTPAWRRVTLQAPKPGEFVLSGQLASREDADRLIEYIHANFTNLYNVQNQLLIEEETQHSAETVLERLNFRNIKVQLSGNEVLLTGSIATGRENDFQSVVDQIKQLPGVSHVRIQVTQLPPEATLINLTGRYQVSGYSSRGGVSTTVVINGRILNRGDTLDGMTITAIKPNAVLLEQGGVRYRIDY